MRRLAPVMLAALLLTGCASQTPAAPSQPAESTPVAPERADVDWNKLPADYQRIVDEETAEGDCTALQEMFDVAPDDAELLTYLDEALRIAGCYDD